MLDYLLALPTAWTPCISAPSTPVTVQSWTMTPDPPMARRTAMTFIATLTNRSASTLRPRLQILQTYAGHIDATKAFDGLVAIPPGTSTRQFTAFFARRVPEGGYLQARLLDPQNNAPLTCQETPL